VSSGLSCGSFWCTIRQQSTLGSAKKNVNTSRQRWNKKLVHMLRFVLHCHITVFQRFAEVLLYECGGTCVSQMHLLNEKVESAALLSVHMLFRFLPVKFTPILLDKPSDAVVVSRSTALYRSEVELITRIY
jgi:hypothetical protein